MTSPSGHNLNPERAQEAPSSKDPTLDIVDIRSELPDIVDAFPGHNLPPVLNKRLYLYPIKS